MLLVCLLSLDSKQSRSPRDICFGHTEQHMVECHQDIDRSCGRTKHKDIIGKGKRGAVQISALWEGCCDGLGHRIYALAYSLVVAALHTRLAIKLAGTLRLAQQCF